MFSTASVAASNALTTSSKLPLYRCSGGPPSLPNSALRLILL